MILKVNGYILPEHALHPIEFIESFCKHIKGKYAGTPIELELWQKQE